MKIVIIGGVAAGAKAAAKIKRLLPNSSVTSIQMIHMFHIRLVVCHIILRAISQTIGHC